MKNDLHLVCPALPVHQPRTDCEAIGTSQLRPLPAALVHGRAHRVDHGDVLAPRGALAICRCWSISGRHGAGHCKIVAPQFQQAARQLEPGSGWPRSIPRINPTGRRFGIRSIPTLALFRGGREIAPSGRRDGRWDIVRWDRRTQRGADRCRACSALR